MLRKNNFHLGDKSGSTLLIAVLVMLALSAVAVITAQLATTNLDSAVGVKHHQANFYKTDADIQILNAIMVDTLIDRQQNPNMNPSVNIIDPEYYLRPIAGQICPTGPGDADVAISQLGAVVDLNFINRTFVTTGMGERLNPGNSILIAEGYEGVGKSLAGTGLLRTYTHRALGIGRNNSQTRLSFQYQYIP